MDGSAKPPGTARSSMRTFLKWAGTVLGSMLIGAFLSPLLQHYFDIDQPDIRFTFTQPAKSEVFQLLQESVDLEGNSLYLVSAQLMVKNVAFKHGQVARAELVPFTITPLPKIEVLGVEGRSIGWLQVQKVEIRALLTFKPGMITYRPPKAHTIEFEARLFDNTGRQVGRFENGMDARIRLPFHVWVPGSKKSP